MRDREGERMSDGGAERKGERENLEQAPDSMEPQAELDLTTKCDLSWNQESA